ncbi:MAG: hypothetical protein JNK87_26470 [Bryobacterales bacterium]|nr:hypothetical protein [Bryobacterales bacterium]
MTRAVHKPPLLNFWLTLYVCQLFAADGVRSLTIAVVNGEGAFNDLRGRRAVTPVVDVRDQNGRGVPGTDVTFTLPFTGAGGTFPRGERVLRVKTDAQGRAMAEGMAPNGIEGRFAIVVEASKDDTSARTLIHQSNTRAVGEGGSRSKRWLVLASMVGAGITGTVVALSSSGGSTPAVEPVRPTLVSVGGVTVGGPR